jgi:hypothetical protein
MHLSTSISFEIITRTKESFKVTIEIHLVHIGQTRFTLENRMFSSINLKIKIMLKVMSRLELLFPNNTINQ